MSTFVTPYSGMSLQDGGGVDVAEQRPSGSPLYMPTVDQPEPAMWNIGIMARFTESGVNRHWLDDAVEQTEEVLVGQHHALGQTRSCPTCRAASAMSSPACSWPGSSAGWPPTQSA